MIYIKDKGKRTQIFIPRYDGVNVDYATQSDIEELNNKFKLYYTKIEVDNIINNTLGTINNELEEILE